MNPKYFVLWYLHTAFMWNIHGSYDTLEEATNAYVECLKSLLPDDVLITKVIP